MVLNLVGIDFDCMSDVECNIIMFSFNISIMLKIRELIHWNEIENIRKIYYGF